MLASKPASSFGSTKIKSLVFTRDRLRSDVWLQPNSLTGTFKRSRLTSLTVTLFLRPGQCTELISTCEAHTIVGTLEWLVVSHSAHWLYILCHRFLRYVIRLSLLGLIATTKENYRFFMCLCCGLLLSALTVLLLAHAPESARGHWWVHGSAVIAPFCELNSLLA